MEGSAQRVQPLMMTVLGDPDELLPTDYVRDGDRLRRDEPRRRSDSRRRAEVVPSEMLVYTT